MRKDKRQKIVAEAKDCLQRAERTDSENRDKAEEDLRFAFSGDTEDQWEKHTWEQRPNRPRLADNRIEPVIDQLVGDQRQNRPSIKLRATEDGDSETRDVLEGLIRNILANSNAEAAWDRAYEYACACGIGGWQVIPEYLDDDGFDQDIVIKPIYNPFSMYWDPSANEDTLEDASWMLVAEWMGKEAFEARYSGHLASDFGDDGEWYRRQTDEVRIADYWKKIHKKRTLVLLSDGRQVFADEIKGIEGELEALGITVVKEREVNAYKVQWCKVSGSDVLEGPIEYDWKYIPIVPTFGKKRNIAGQTVYKGIVRNSKDSQRSLNYTKSALLENAALAPKTPPILTPKMIKNHEAQWQSSHRKNYPFLLVNPDPEMPGPPQRMASQGIAPELLQMAEIDIGAIRAQTGYHEASLGAASNETSGRALLARQRQGDTGTYQYLDNLSKSIQHTGRILVDMIPTVYDTERTVRILGPESEESFKTLNQRVIEDGKERLINDMSVGKYDVTVTTGPSYSTQRQESSERLIQLAGVAPQVMQIGADVIIKGLDLPDGDELVKRLRRQMIKAGMVEPGDDPEEQALVQQQPDPMAEQQAMLALRALLAQVEEAELDNLIKKGEIERLPLESQKLRAGGTKMQEIISERVSAQAEAIDAGVKLTSTTL